MKKKDGSCILFTQKTSNRSSLFDQEKRKEMEEGNIIQPIPPSIQKNTKIEKERTKGEREDNPLARSRERKRMYKSNKITNDD